MLTKLWRKLRQQDRVEELEAKANYAREAVYDYIKKVRDAERLAYKENRARWTYPDGEVALDIVTERVLWKDLYEAAEKERAKLARIRAILDEEEA